MDANHIATNQKRDRSNRLISSVSTLDPSLGDSCGSPHPPCSELESTQHDAGTLQHTRFERPFTSSGTSGSTIWYTSSDRSPLRWPPSCINPNSGNIYIHTDTSTNGRQMWISLSAGCWVGVPFEYDPNYLPDRVVMTARHPLFNDRVLKIRANGEPSWVTRQTCVTLKSRRKVAHPNK